MSRKPLRVLMIEDSEDDAELLALELGRAGYAVNRVRVHSAEALGARLDDGGFDLILADFSLPGFGALEALGIVKARGIDLPFLVVSGSIGEEVAVAALKAGAHDFISKDRLARLAPAIERELREAAIRRRSREATEALRASEVRFRTLVDSLDDVVITLGPDGRIDGAFGRGLTNEGLSPEMLAGRTPTELLGPEHAARHVTALARARAGERVVYEWSFPSSRGTRSFQISLARQEAEPGQRAGLVAVGRDVTDAKALQAKLLAADRLGSLGSLAAGVAHEVNAPLTAVLANLDLALAGSSGVPGPIREALSDAREATGRVRSIMEDLRIYSRAPGAATATADVERVLASALRMSSGMIKPRARLVTRFGAVPAVVGDPSRLGQVFTNLIVNAAQAMDEAHREANELRVATYEREGGVVVEVADTGTGIPPHVLRVLFQEAITTKPQGEGTGIGLTICKRILDAVGGKISVESRPGGGSTFRVTLRPASGPPPEPEIPERTIEAPVRRGRVMVLDDEPLVGRSVARILAAEHAVEVFDDPVKALAATRAGSRYDLILSDLLMPGLSGLALLEELERIAPDQAAAVVFLTGGAFSPRTHEFLVRHPERWIPKPVGRDELRALVNRRVR